MLTIHIHVVETKYAKHGDSKLDTIAKVPLCNLFAKLALRHCHQQTQVNTNQPFDCTGEAVNMYQSQSM